MAVVVFEVVRFQEAIVALNPLDPGTVRRVPGGYVQTVPGQPIQFFSDEELVVAQVGELAG